MKFFDMLVIFCGLDITVSEMTPQHGQTEIYSNSDSMTKTAFVGYHMCIEFEPFIVKASVTTYDPSFTHTFKATVGYIDSTGFLVKLERTDQFTGWQAHLVVHWVIYFKGCPSEVYNFPRANQVTDYIRYRLTVPSLSAATVCMWFRTSNVSGDTLLSYATSNARNNEMWIVLQSSTRINFYMDNNKAKLFTIPDMANKWTHMCVWFSTQTSQVGMFINGTSVGSFPYSGGVLRDGGSLIFGQDQDRVNASGLDASQSFSGQMVSPMIWPRVLNQSEINDVIQLCLCPRDPVMAMTIDKTQLHGAVEHSSVDCFTL